MNTKTTRLATTTASVLGAVLLAVLLVAAGSHIDALAGSGVTGKMPKGAESIKKILDALNDNMLWLVITCASTAITLGGVLMALGHSRAQDHLIRIGGGIGIALFLAPAVVA
ncbi:MAG TPA: hypothetical protein PKB03_00130 [Baekduia sp.]|nr:hypothetical protein [Baekduia sp.]